MQSLLTRKPIKTNTVSVYDRPNNDVYRAPTGHGAIQKHHQWEFRERGPSMSENISIWKKISAKNEWECTSRKISVSMHRPSRCQRTRFNKSTCLWCHRCHGATASLKSGKNYADVTSRDVFFSHYSNKTTTTIIRRHRDANRNSKRRKLMSRLRKWRNVSADQRHPRGHIKAKTWPCRDSRGQFLSWSDPTRFSWGTCAHAYLAKYIQNEPDDVSLQAARTGVKRSD